MQPMAAAGFRIPCYTSLREVLAQVQRNFPYLRVILGSANIQIKNGMNWLGKRSDLGTPEVKFNGALVRPPDQASFIVENRTGGDGLIGIRAVKGASPDGATILVTTGPTMYLLPMV